MARAGVVLLNDRWSCYDLRRDSFSQDLLIYLEKFDLIDRFQLYKESVAEECC